MEQNPKDGAVLNYKYIDGLPINVIEMQDVFLYFIPSTEVYTGNVQQWIVAFLASSNAYGDFLSGDVNLSLNQFLLGLFEQVIKCSKSKITLEFKNEANDFLNIGNPARVLMQQITNKYEQVEMVMALDDLTYIGHSLDNHYPEAYIAWVFSSDNPDIYGECRYKTAIIDCPVDVYVYDNAGNLVTSIIDNEIVKEEVNAAVFGDQKRVYLSDETYSIKLVGNDTGTMDYSVEEHDSDGRMTRRVSYYDLPLENGKTYIGTVNDIHDTPASDYNLTSDDETATPDFDSNTVTTEAYTISVTGGLASKAFAYPGEQVTVTALAPADDSEFSHWSTKTALIDNISMPVATFVMPSSDVELIAVSNAISTPSEPTTPSEPSTPSKPSTPSIPSIPSISYPITPPVIVDKDETDDDSDEEFYEDVSSASGTEVSNTTIDSDSNYMFLVFIPVIVGTVIVLRKTTK